MRDNNQPSAAERRLRLVYLLLCLAYMGYALWATMIPDHQKTALRLKLLRSSGRGMNQLARHTGEASMRRELVTGEQLYGLPYRLSLCRLAIERAYDRARNVST